MTATLPASRLVGRDQQLDELERIFDDVRAGRPATVVVAGEAGIGKSRLISEFGTRVRQAGAHVVVGHSVPLDGGGPAFTPLVGVLRGLVDEFGADAVLDLAGPGAGVLGSLVPLLGDPAPPPAGAVPGSPGGANQYPPGRGPLYEVVTSLLERIAADAALVVTVEDVHWADAATRDLLRFLIRGLYRAPVLLVLSYRSDEVHRGHPIRPWLAELERVPSVHRIDLPRLDRDHVAAQLTDLLGRRPSAAETGTVFRRSEGVPFFVEELAAVDTAGMPTTLAELLLTRIERLRPQTQQLLRVLSASGGGIRHELVDVVTAELDVGSLDEALREAVSAGVLVVRGDHYVFRHALLREAVHGDMLPGERARTHATYARALEARRDLAEQGRCASEVAYHWTQARDDARAFHWSLAAIDELADAYAFAAALEAAERVLELWDRVDDVTAQCDGDQVDLLARAARLAVEAGELGRATTLIKAALAGLDPADTQRQGPLLTTLGELELKHGSLGALDTLERARSIAAEHGSALARARVADGLAMMLMLACRFTESLERAEEAMELAAEAGDDPLRSSALNTRGACLAQLGHDVEEVMADYALARELAGDHPRSLLRYHVNYADSLMLMRRFTEAVDVAMAGKVRARELGRKRSLGSMLAGNAAEPLIALGEWDRAASLVTRAIELDPPPVHMFHLRLLDARVNLWRGNVDGAAETLELLDAEARPLVVPQNTRARARVWVDLALARGETDAAWRIVRETLPTDPAATVPAYDLPLAAAAARVIGERRRANAAGADLAAVVAVDADATDLAATVEAMDHTNPGSPWPILVAAELTAPDDPGAVGAWTAAVERLDAPDAEVVFGAYARMRLGRAQIEAGRRDAARVTLREAAARADRLGAGLLRGWIDDLARRGGVALIDAVGDGAGSGGLTPRELEVLRLVADGYSNGEIGADLFISTKTASVHVSHILAKLGASSRGEAAAKARRQGILDTAAS